MDFTGEYYRGLRGTRSSYGTLSSEAYIGSLLQNPSEPLNDAHKSLASYSSSNHLTLSCDTAACLQFGRSIEFRVGKKLRLQHVCCGHVLNIVARAFVSSGYSPWGIWRSYYNIPKAIFYLLKGDYGSRADS